MDLFTNKTSIIIGLDPGSQTTGIACWNEKDCKFIQLMTKTFWEAVGFLNEVKEGREINLNGTIKGVGLIIENPYLNKPVFPMKSETEDFKKAIQTGDYELHEKTLRIFSRRAQNIGMNKKLSLLMIDIANMKGFRVTEVRPSKSKLNAGDFNRKTGWKGKSSQHSRDAARLIFPV